MSLSSEQLKKWCEFILKSRKIQNKIVVLCEGASPKIQGRESPQAYRAMEQMPDANFYKACIPAWWRQNRPEFFNCGDRKDVIDTYFTLLTLHEQDSTNSYLDCDRLFAMIDLDLHLQAIENYVFTDTEAIFCNLYEKSQVQKQNVAQHRIWITGLIHKEAYFLTPELQSLFDDYPNSPIYQENLVSLTNIYSDMADGISSDGDLQLNLKRAFDRINHCSGLNCTQLDLDKFQDSWKHQFQNTTDATQKHELILALLTIKKANDYWKQIKPPGDWSGDEKNFREQLSLEIGRFYSQQSSDVKSHIPFFFKALHESVLTKHLN
ncbi:MAG: hypothetical protein JGK35_27015 [Microcoleus sp. PH2017_16_JOR_D_A]|uniref:hypothetical protein n=1 Tax=Microcoleus sp. PH2017_16_JOR_D_A TaxID=2798827 RepID=UPI001D73B9D7|nr:hypothetical protein [Microcoleus sp. PH2017_16_JOR_D_A]MCC3494104.1 hypothetical protein [Microcoleus sp. PH2017_16_JOR_D_A]